MPVSWMPGKSRIELGLGSGWTGGRISKYLNDYFKWMEMGRFSFPSSIPNLDRCWRSLPEAWLPSLQTEIRTCRCRGQAEALGLRVEDCKAESRRCDVIRRDWKKFGKFEDSESTSSVGFRQDRVVSIGGEALPAVSDASFQEVGLRVLVRSRRSKSFRMTG